MLIEPILLWEYIKDKIFLLNLNAGHACENFNSFINFLLLYYFIYLISFLLYQVCTNELNINIILIITRLF